MDDSASLLVGSDEEGLNKGDLLKMSVDSHRRERYLRVQTFQVQQQEFNDILEDLKSSNVKLQHHAALRLRQIGLKCDMDRSSVPATFIPELVSIITNHTASSEIISQIIQFVAESTARSASIVPMLVESGFHCAIMSLLKENRQHFRPDQCLASLDILSRRSSVVFNSLYSSDYLESLISMFYDVNASYYRSTALNSISEFISSVYYVSPPEEELVGLVELALSTIYASKDALTTSLASPVFRILTNVIRVAPAGPQVANIIKSSVSVLAATLLDPENEDLSEACSTFLVVATYNYSEICQQLRSVSLPSLVGAAFQNAPMMPCMTKILLAIYNITVGKDEIAIESINSADFVSFLKNVLHNGTAAAIRQAMMLTSLLISLSTRNMVLDFARELDLAEVIQVIVDSGQGIETAASLLALIIIVESDSVMSSQDNEYTSILLQEETYFLVQRLLDDPNPQISSQASRIHEWLVNNAQNTK